MADGGIEQITPAQYETPVNEAVLHLNQAIKSLKRIVVDGCPRANEFASVSRDSLRRAFNDLLKVRDDEGY